MLTVVYGAVASRKIVSVRVSTLPHVVPVLHAHRLGAVSPGERDRRARSVGDPGPYVPVPGSIDIEAMPDAASLTLEFTVTPVTFV